MSELNQQLKGLNLTVQKALYDTYLYKKEASQLKADVFLALEEAEKEIDKRNNSMGNPGHGALMVESDIYRNHYKPYRSRVESLRDIIMLVGNMIKHPDTLRQFEIFEGDQPATVKQNILSAINQLENLSNVI